MIYPWKWKISLKYDFIYHKFKVKIVNNYLSKAKQTNIFTNYGPIVQELEKYIHTKFKIDTSKAVICCNNGTSALYALTSGLSIFKKKELQF